MATIPENDDDQDSLKRDLQRDRLALIVFTWSATGVLSLGIATILVSILADDGGAADKVFSSTLPVFGTWAGTVLAFYFSRQNFEAASKSLHQTIETLSDGDRLKSTPVSAAMIRLDKMKTKTVTGGNDAAVLVSELQAMLVSPVTRIPILNDDKSARYLVHESMLFKFLATKTGAGMLNPATATLADLKADAELGSMIVKFGFVPADGTLADAKNAMEAIPGAQDVFVTQSGGKPEPIVGWLTNVDISESIKLKQ